MLKGEAKKAYQREYMRARRLKLKLEGTMLDPSTSKPIKTSPSNKELYERWLKNLPDVVGWPLLVPGVDADGNVIYEE